MCIFRLNMCDFVCETSHVASFHSIGQLRGQVFKLYAGNKILHTNQNYGHGIANTLCLQCV